MRRAVVVGGSLAAVHAIEALREFGHDGDITLLSGEDVLPYDRPPLSKEALREGVEPAHLSLRDPQWYDTLGVRTVLGRRAVALDAGRRRVLVSGGGRLDYDGLLIATGSRPRSLPDPLRAHENVFVLRTLADCRALRRRMVQSRNLVVIGAGFIGLEVAATARSMGLAVSVVELAPAPLTRVLGDEAGEWFMAHHRRHGVDLYCGEMVDEIEYGRVGSKVRLRDGTVLSADLIVAGTGALPATAWLEGSGVQVANGVVCDETLATSRPGVVAAGDVANWFNPLFDETMRIEQWSNAVAQGRHAAATLLGERAAYAGIPYFWSDQFEAKMRFVGRSNGAGDVKVVVSDAGHLVTLFGRDGTICGALCVNAPRQLVLYRRAIEDQVAWGDVG